MTGFNMKGVLFFLIFLGLAGFKLENQTRYSSVSLNFERFSAEMRSFINYVQPESFQNGKFNVYLAKFVDNHGAEPCVTFEYIFTTLIPITDLRDFDHYTFVDSSLVLLNFEAHFLERYDFQDSTVNILKSTKIITDHLYDGDLFTSTPAWVVCFGENVTSIKKYRSESSMPQESRIFIDRGKGVIREAHPTELGHKKKNK